MRRVCPSMKFKSCTSHIVAIGLEFVYIIRADLWMRCTRLVFRNSMERHKCISLTPSIRMCAYALIANANDNDDDDSRTCSCMIFILLILQFSRATPHEIVWSGNDDDRQGIQGDWIRKTHPPCLHIARYMYMYMKRDLCTGIRFAFIDMPSVEMLRIQLDRNTQLHSKTIIHNYDNDRIREIVTLWTYTDRYSPPFVLESCEILHRMLCIF